ncbi:MAG: mitochondrial fission ELM1 family protein [Rhodospirillaceae bacterium]|nr:mitochondrial fission ELM1 family protein [Rhodospirillaceae bacterium]
MSAPSVWLLVDDHPGSRAQALGVGRALGIPFEIKELDYTAAAALPNYMLMASFSAVQQKSRVNLAAPWPDLVIAAGRRTAPVARKIKELNKGRTKLVQIMYPGASGEEDFDLICVPRHDTMTPADNRFEIIGAPHGMTPQALALAASQWAGKFDHLPKPWVGLLVGGDTRRKAFTPEMAAELGSHAAQLVRDVGGALLVSTSARTSEIATAALLSAVHGVPQFAYSWGDEGDNPYAAFLALSDHIIVTGDSVSMCCEAAGTTKPLYIYAPKKLTAHKHALLHKNLYADGIAKPFDHAQTLSDWTHPPLNAADDIAAEIRKRLKLD